MRHCLPCLTAPSASRMARFFIHRLIVRTLTPSSSEASAFFTKGTFAGACTFFGKYMRNKNKSRPKDTTPQALNATDPGPPSLSPHVKQILVALLTRAEVARRLSVCPATIQRATRRGELAAIVFNKRLIRYDPNVVEAYIAAAQ